MNYIKNKWLVVKNSKVFLGLICLIIGSTYCYIYLVGVPYYNWMITGYNFAIESVEAKQGTIGENESYPAKGNQEDISLLTEKEIGNESISPISLKGIFTAYNAEVGQTDSDPTTMASGKKVYDGAIANNCLPFGTKIQLNGKTYTVDDKMNSRYDCNHFDIYMESYDEAIKFGKQELRYKI